MKRRTYPEFMAQVDKKLISLCGMTHMDLGDTLTRDQYDEGWSVDEVVQDILEYNGFPVEALED